MTPGPASGPQVTATCRECRCQNEDAEPERLEANGACLATMNRSQLKAANVTSDLLKEYAKRYARWPQPAPGMHRQH